MNKSLDFLNEELYVNLNFADYRELYNWRSWEGCFRNDNALYYIIDGEAEIYIDGVRYILKRGDLCLIPAASRISYRQTSDVFKKFFVHFDLNCAGLPAFCKLSFKNAVNFGCEKAIEDRFRALARQMYLTGGGSSRECISLLFELLTLFFEAAQYEKAELSKSEYKVYRAVGYIVRNVKNNIHIKDIAEYVNTHPKYLSRIFKENLGCSINRFINYKKVDCVLLVLLFNDNTLKEAMDSVNYSDYQSVNNWFHILKRLDLKEFLKNYKSFSNPCYRLPKSDNSFSEILSYIKDNLNEALTLPAIAGHFNMTAKSLSIQFKGVTGMTLSQYISDLKYNKALEYMRCPEYTLYDIAESVGFQSYEGFRKFIKRKSGEFPAELRSKL